MKGERGFTVIELLVAAAVGTALIAGLALAANRLVFHAAAANARVRAADAAERLLERIASEAASAWAVYVPAQDLLGTSNADGHELDLCTEDGAHRPFCWAYTYEAATQRVTRYAYAPNQTPVATDTYDAITTFSVDELAASAAGSADALFGGASVSDVSYRFDALAQARGGNGLARVRLIANGVERVELFSSATAPTHFTVVIPYTPSPPPAATPTPNAIPFTSATP